MCAHLRRRPCALGARDEGAHRLAGGHPRDVVGLIEVEDDDRQVVLHAQAHGGRVEDPQLIAQQVRVFEMSVPLGVGMRHRVLVVDAVDLRRLEQDFGVDLDGTKRGGRVGREVRVAGAGDEQGDASLLEVTDRASADVRLGDLVHRDRGHDPGRDAGPLEGVLERQAVHDGREHPDVVARGPVHPPCRRGEAAEDVAAADDDPDLHAKAMDLGDLARDERAERPDRRRTADRRGAPRRTA